MHPKSTLILPFGPNGPQTFGLRMVGIVQKAGVLHRKHLFVLRRALDRPLVMGRAYALRCCLVVIEKPIGCFGVSPIFTSLVDRPVGLHRKAHSQVDAAAIQSGVLKFDRGEFFKTPLVFG